MAKLFIEVTAVHGADGKIRPLSLKWTDGRVFDIDRVVDVSPGAMLKGGGGVGTRYTCRIKNKEFYLFDDDGRWYILK